jgi:hypothetical protein
VNTRRSLLVVSALLEFARLDLAAWRGFGFLKRAVVNQRVADADLSAADTERIIAAVHAACAFYVRPAKCLLRSAALTRLLRRRGVKANLVIGCQKVPLRGHAWVEIDGRIVSDDIRDRLQFYQVIDRW